MKPCEYPRPMSIFPQPCLALPESPKLRAKQGHTKPATYAKDFSELKNSPLRPLREPSAFSLTEVVIAMGVAAVAFTSIIALFPLGLNMSKESYESTQAALIAKSLMNQATDAQGGSGLTGFRRFATSTNNDPVASNSLTSIDVGNYTSSTNINLAYTNHLDTNGLVYWRPAKTVTDNEWTNGYPNSVALAKVTFRRIFTGGKSYDIHGVDVQIDYPGNVPYTNRTHEIFSRICH